MSRPLVPRDESRAAHRVDEERPEWLESATSARPCWPVLERTTARLSAARDRLGATGSLAKGAVAAVMLLAVATVAALADVSLLASGGPVEQRTPAPPTPTPEPIGAAPEPLARDVFQVRGLWAGEHLVEQVPGAQPFAFTVPERKWGDGWTSFGDVHLTLDAVGSQAAEAMIYWTGFTASNDGVGPEACGQWWGPPVGRTVANLAAAASHALGTALVAGPTDVTVGGHAARRVVLRVRREVDCAPGLLYGWPHSLNGPFWGGIEVGDTVRIWIINTERGPLYIEGATHESAEPDLGCEIQRIVDSIRFG